MAPADSAFVERHLRATMVEIGLAPDPALCEQKSRAEPASSSPPTGLPIATRVVRWEQDQNATSIGPMAIHGRKLKRSCVLAKPTHGLAPALTKFSIFFNVAKSFRLDATAGVNAMKPLSRDVLLKRIKLLQRQYAEQLLTHDHSRLQRFAAAAERIRTQAAQDDIAFVNHQLCRVMVSLGLISSEPTRCPEPRPASLARPASLDRARPKPVASSSTATAT